MPLSEYEAHLKLSCYPARAVRHQPEGLPHIPLQEPRCNKAEAQFSVAVDR